MKFPAHVKAENVVDFSQEDADDYRLRVFVDEIDTESPDGYVDVWMDTFEAVRLYELLRKTIGGYVAEMERYKAEFDRATPEERTQVLHGYACCEPEEEWIEMMREQADLQRKARRENQ